jgi:hypothetical protein
MPRISILALARLRRGAAIVASFVILATAGPAIAFDAPRESARSTDGWSLASAVAPARAAIVRLARDGVGADRVEQAAQVLTAPTVPKPVAKVAPPPKHLAPPKVAKHRTLLAARYTGRNHIWMPALGINRTVYWFSCSRTRPPDNFVYRWGCAGRNNVYLLGHAWGVFKPLHDAYVQGRLRVGMEVIYADAAGRVRHYRIVSWRIVSPTVSNWIGSFSRPTMILQTCVGTRSQYRLNVKLVATT